MCICWKYIPSTSGYTLYIHLPAMEYLATALVTHMTQAVRCFAQNMSLYAILSIMIILVLFRFN